MKLRQQADSEIQGVTQHLSAVAGGAELLITGDADLLAVAHQAPIPVLTPRAFWERLRAT